MKRNNVIFLCMGLLFGFVLGAALISVDDSLRESLFGTASSGDSSEDSIEIKRSKFYLVKFDDAEEWLASLDPEDAQLLGNDLEKVAGLAEATDLVQYYSESSDSIDKVLSTLHGALISGEEIQGLNTCLALESNPYSQTEPGLYLYLEVPLELEDEIPTDWEELEGPREDNMLWTTECYEEG